MLWHPWNEDTSPSFLKNSFLHVCLIDWFQNHKPANLISLSLSLSLSQNPDTDEVTDFFSFYHLPSTIVKHPIHQLLHVAYSFYNVAMVTPLKDLVQDSLIIAKKVRGDIRLPIHELFPQLTIPTLIQTLFYAETRV